MLEIAPEQVFKARKNAKLTAAAAGRLVYISGKMWRRYETGDSPIDLARYELFLIKTNQVIPQQ